tara:strand:- start:18 stop:239 length:222 start_codon:yes stop_codon:yes gene_type:complete
VLERFNLEKTYQYLLVALAFLMPLTVAGANLVIVIIMLLWLCSGDYKTKYNEIIGMFWTEDLEWGFHVLQRVK